MATANSGLVRRRTAVENSSDYNGSSTSASNNDHNDNFKDEAESENMEETSDKETRLTLMEEVLLLGLKDKEVSWRIRREAPSVPMISALRIRSEKKF